MEVKYQRKVAVMYALLGFMIRWEGIIWDIASVIVWPVSWGRAFLVKKIDKFNKF